ncbi:UNVERIFIED_CONTAM: hypothetical protein FKN15_076309 [Acipenser sinensis]
MGHQQDASTVRRMASQLISSGDGGGISRHSSSAGAGLSGGHSGSSLLGIEDTWVWSTAQNHSAASPTRPWFQASSYWGSP